MKMTVKEFTKELGKLSEEALAIVNKTVCERDNWREAAIALFPAALLENGTKITPQKLYEYGDKELTGLYKMERKLWAAKTKKKK
jgi:hypothetical protein